MPGHTLDYARRCALIGEAALLMDRLPDDDLLRVVAELRATAPRRPQGPRSRGRRDAERQARAQAP